MTLIRKGPYYEGENSDKRFWENWQNGIQESHS